MRDPGELGRNLIRVVFAFCVIVLAGTFGYVLIEGWGFFDSFYMVAITITTTGYGEVHSLSAAGRVLSISLMVTGIGIFFYGLNIIIPALVERKFERWKKVIEDIKDHYIVCGFGDMGVEVAQEVVGSLGEENVVILDPRMDKISLAREKGYLALQGDATQEEALLEAKVGEAKAMVACMDDSENAFATMVAKDLNPSIYTIAVSHSKSGEKNIKRAGADYILSPYSDTARKAAVLLQNPVAAEFAELVSEVAEGGMLQRVAIREGGPVGRTLKELDLRGQTGVTVLALGRGDQVRSPKPNLDLEVGDQLYMIGDEDELRKASDMLGGLGLRG